MIRWREEERTVCWEEGKRIRKRERNTERERERENLKAHLK